MSTKETNNLENMSDSTGDGLNPMPSLLEEYGKRATFKANLASLVNQSESSASNFPIEAKINRLSIRKIWDRMKLNLVAAACIAVISAFATLWLSGYYQNLEVNTSNYKELRRDMNHVKRNVIEHNLAIRDISVERRDAAAVNNFGATGFMISSEGYVVTNYHVIADADSVHLQHPKGQSYKASVIHTDKDADLAFLRITDSNFKKVSQLPYTFKTNDSQLGEDVFTLGFPRDETVYGQGYLSSKSGYKGDTTAYQISIPLNPGNSGGPLLDNRGNIIGIISGKQAGLDGTSFAIKTSALLKSLDGIPADSLEKPLRLNQRNTLSKLQRTEQIKRIQDYVFMVKVY